MSPAREQDDEITLRRLRPTDALALGRFFETVAADPEAARFFFPHPLTPEFARDLCGRLERMRDRYYVLCVAGHIAAYALLRGWDDGYDIPSYGMCSHPDLRDSGVGQALCTHMMAEARAAGATRLRGNMAKNNARMVHMHRKLGFQFSDRGPDRLIALRDLTADVPWRSWNAAALLAWARRRQPHDERKPFRLGVWCHYGKTLTPHEGIGVFVHNLVAGLLDLDEPLEVVLLIRGGEDHVVRPLQDKAPERVRILPEKAPRFSTGWFLATWSRASGFVHGVVQRAGDWSRHLWGRWKETWIALARKASYGSCVAALACLVLLGPVFLLSWLALALACAVKGGLTVAVYPLLCLDGLLRRLSVNSRFTVGSSELALARAARCDAWVIPYVGFEHALPQPAVVFVHDLVVYHHPEGFAPAFVSHLKRIVPQRVCEAALCGCMSNFIKQTDLLGILGLGEDKVRMVRPAPPTDFRHDAPADDCVQLPARLKKPFLFYPAAFRPYKNHALLVHALACLREYHGDEDFDLVFTGPTADELPLHLDALARQTQTRQRIHVLGRLDRATLAALYRRAFVTLIPSLYEQGSFLIYEALRSGCPVACADIPSLREQCADMGAAMRYFDPRDPLDLAQLLRDFRGDRAAIAHAQVQASRAWQQRTWKTAAAEWLTVFREAAALGKTEPARMAA